MKEKLSDLLEESIELELNAGRLYQIYSEFFTEDRGFWHRMSMEEMNHASLLKSARNFLAVGKFPPSMLCPDPGPIRDASALIKEKIAQYRDKRPSRPEAYRFALELETSAAEQHMQDIMHDTGDDKVLEIFKKLAGDDLDHAERIKALINSI